MEKAYDRRNRIDLAKDRAQIGQMADETREIVRHDLRAKRQKALAKEDWQSAAGFHVLAEGLDTVRDVDMVDLSRCWLKPEDLELWDATEEIAATSNCGINGAIQAYIRTRGGPPTEKEIEDYREVKLAEERKQWDADFGYSEPGTAVDRLLAKNKK